MLGGVGERQVSICGLRQSRTAVQGRVAVRGKPSPHLCPTARGRCTPSLLFDAQSFPGEEGPTEGAQPDP